jgi:GLPGLI family protein
MKAKLFAMSLTMLSVIAWGQEKSVENISSGRIYYEEKIKLDIKLEGDASQYSDMLPKERKTEKILSFSNEATLFENSKDIADEMTQEPHEGVNVKMIIGGDDVIYTDLKNQKIIEQREFMNRMFLVGKELPVADWKLTGNQKVILGYPCMEATKQDTAGVTTTVWFASSLTVKGGPAGFCNLPGMVLEVNVNDGSHTFLAKSIEPVVPGELKIKKPGEGKKVTEAEYKKIVSEKMKEMGMDDDKPGDGAHVRIIIKN